MKGGGTIFFDLREDGAGADALTGGATAASDALRRILAKLDIPPLEPVPETHVLTKSFYLLDRFPGRYDGGKLWVERTDSEGAAIRQHRRGERHHHRLQRLCRRLGDGRERASRSSPPCRAPTGSANSPSAPASTS